MTSTTATATFRQHDEVPDGITSALYRQLLQEWVTLNASPTARVLLRRWARAHPVLAGFERPGDVVDAIDAADHARTDELLGTLLSLLRDGHQLAGRVLLQTMLPKLLRLAQSTNRQGTDRLEDQRQMAVAEFWVVVTTYPLERRPTRIAANLAMETLNHLSKRQPPPTEAPYEPHRVTDLLERRDGGHTHDQERAAVAGYLTSSEDLVQVVTWGVGNQAITAAEATLIGAVYGHRSGTNGTYGYAAAAAALGITQEAARARCSRAVRKLTAAARADLFDTPTTRASAAA